ncbi:MULTISPECIES: YebG family protein [Aliiglaciecola]|uniref:YebG family protein n=1 Tax=Aliiglaciecola TaxID=1406885 RepID=UPI001C099C65|nr:MULTISPECIES: YebG family protein [Aliiglaciecola]MBU2878175.1 YebG family protein [Aliiglaciecola lipolytica]MDO6711636.1 YebG family protein [Aliiglaciecola sp. 2_MG-2023]MDO6752707.1 YebG family protein [Aliiglaciecola sp. 1_MG-2023]
MAIIVKYVVERNGEEKLVTSDKKAADQYDKMLDVADNLSTYIQAKGIKLPNDVSEELTIMLSKNKDVIAKLFKGTDADSILEQEKAEVVKMDKKKA